MTSLAVLGVLTALVLVGVLTLDEAFGGFAGPAPITVAALAIVARAVEKTGLLRRVALKLLGAAGTPRAALVRLLAPAALLSAVLPETSVASRLVPCALEWATRRRLAASLLLMPLAFAILLGGTLTLMGAAANLVVSALLEGQGHSPLGLFEPARLALPAVVAAVVLMVVAAPALLRERPEARRQLEEGGRQFTLAMRVVPGGELDGQAVEAGGLRHLQGMFLMAVERGGYFVAPVGPQLVLKGGDILTFVGRADLVVDLQTTRGLVAAERAHVAHFDTTSHAIFEGVLGPASQLVGRTLSEVGFRGRYQAAVVAVHRAGERMHVKLSEVRLRRGDTLFLLADPGFAERWCDSGDFLLLTRVGSPAPLPSYRLAALPPLILVSIAALAATGVLALPVAALTGAGVLVATGALSRAEIRGAIDLDFLVTVGGSIGLATAVDKSGVAGWLAGLASGIGPLGALAAAVVLTMALTQVLPNLLAAALAFPVAMELAARAGPGAGADARGFAIAVAVAASASFLTPFASRPTTMVCGPAGYRFSDFRRLGWPLAAVVAGALLLGS
ncbi:MAG TPA: SLC13 family permease [Gemmatimonadales bacterium]|nr:SLC13 family permease [Gemmatimonadales bacterium]